MTEQELLEIKAEVENSAVPKPSQERILEACEKQVARKVTADKSENETDIRCPSCKAKIVVKFKRCGRCGQNLDWSGEDV